MFALAHQKGLYGQIQGAGGRHSVQEEGYGEDGWQEEVIAYAQNADIIYVKPDFEESHVKERKLILFSVLLVIPFKYLYLDNKSTLKKKSFPLFIKFKKHFYKAI